MLHLGGGEFSSSFVSYVFFHVGIIVAMGFIAIIVIVITAEATVASGLIIIVVTEMASFAVMMWHD